MKKINALLTGKVYAVKRQYPTLMKLEKGMREVKKELNKGSRKK